MIHGEVDAATGLVDFHVSGAGQLKLRTKVRSDIENEVSHVQGVLYGGMGTRPNLENFKDSYVGV